MRVLLALFLLIAVATGPGLAVSPSEQLDDRVLEERARDLSKELRCLVCQNQSIDDSDADFARDMRVLVRERIVAGDTDEEVLAFLTARYGDFVRLRPPFTAATLALWITPIVITVIAMIGAIVYLRGRRAGTPDGERLSEEEERALQALLAAREERD